MRALRLLAAFVLLAGCAADAPPAEPQDGSPSTSGAATPVAPDAATPVPEPVPFTWAGHTKEGAWVCTEQSGLGQCPAGQQVAPDGQHVTVLAYAGAVTAVELTMTWQADPTQTGLVLAVYSNRTGQGPLAVVQGDSPLTLRIEGDAIALLPPDDVLVFLVWPEGKTPTSPSVFLDATQQPFTVDGTIWQLRPARGA